MVDGLTSLGKFLDRKYLDTNRGTGLYYSYIVSVAITATVLRELQIPRFQVVSFVAPAVLMIAGLVVDHRRTRRALGRNGNASRLRSSRVVSRLVGAPRHSTAVGTHRLTNTGQLRLEQKHIVQFRRLMNKKEYAEAEELLAAIEPHECDARWYRTARIQLDSAILRELEE